MLLRALGALAILIGMSGSALAQTATSESSSDSTSSSSSDSSSGSYNDGNEQVITFNSPPENDTLTIHRQSSVIAPGLTGGPCMGSTSAGISTPWVGLTAGSTWKDGDCVRGKLAYQMYAWGHVDAAKALLCINEEVKMAYKLAGLPCPELPEDEVSTAQTMFETIKQLAAVENSTDYRGRSDDR